MEPLTIPPSPNWYETKIAICAPDNTLVYGAGNSIVVIKPAPWDKPSAISVIPFAHLDKVHGLAMAPTWNDQHQMVASVADDKIVKVWNILDNACAFSHKAHAPSKSRPVGVAFASDAKLVSVSADGMIIIWKMSTNEIISNRNLLGTKVHVTAISTCPHAGWRAAFGLKTGLIIVADLRNKGSILYKLRGHEREVLDFAWCPKAVNVFLEAPVEKKQEVIEKKEVIANVELEQTEETCDTIDAMPENSTHILCALDAQAEKLHQIGSVTSDDSVAQNVEAHETDQPPVSNVKLKKENPWVDLKFPDDEEATDGNKQTADESSPQASKDFLKECDSLKAKILETKEDIVVGDESEEVVEPKVDQNSSRLILQAVRGRSSDEKNVFVVIDTGGEVSERVDRADASEALKPEFLLASSSRGGRIVIWRAGTDGRMQTSMRIARPRSRMSRTSNNPWLALHWIAPEKLLSSGASGELLVWQMSGRAPQSKLVHNDHPRQLFCITSPYGNEHAAELAAWTLGQDRSIFYTTLLSRKVLACYPTFSCPVMSVAASPIAPTRIALGLSDGFIRVWDLGKENKQCIQQSAIKTQVGGKVISLAWHTAQDYVLAFGTEEGQIGHVNASQKSKPPVYFAHAFRTMIHKLEWALVPQKDVGKPGLYCCSDGQLVVYDLETPLVKPANVKTFDNEYITNFAWKLDGSKLAIGCKSGNVYILTASYELQRTLYYQKKAIVCMVWHPTQTAEDEEISPNHNWLASASSSDNNVVIFDVTKEGVEEVVVGELQGHVKPVNAVFWSPYRNGVIATASEDGTAIVWSRSTPIGTFVNNNAEPLLGGAWSPRNEDLLITAGRDCAVRVWSLREHPVIEQSALEEMRDARKQALSHCRSHKEENQVEAASTSGRSSRQRSLLLFSELAARQSHLATALADCRLLFATRTQRDGGDAVAVDNSVVKLFGDAAGVGDVLATQKEVYRERAKYAPAHHLQLWMGDIGEAIKKAIADGNITPWLLSVAPMVSFSLWQEAMEAYAGQLAESAASDPVEIASYRLALHQADRAIDVLVATQMFREALLLAKLKKADDVELHKRILGQWGAACLASGRFEIAAQSFIAQGQFEDAAKALHKRTDLPSLTLAVELARCAGNEELATTIEYRLDGLRTTPSDVSTGCAHDGNGSPPPLPTRVELEVRIAAAAAAAVRDGGDAANGEHPETVDIDCADNLVLSAK